MNLLHLADHVIALSSEGTIAEQGTFQNLQSSNGYVHRLCTEKQDGAASSTADSGPSKPSATSTPPQAVTVPGASGDISRQTGDWTVYKYYFRTNGKYASVMFISLSAAWAFFFAFPSKTMSPLQLLSLTILQLSGSSGILMRIRGSQTSIQAYI